MPILTRERSSRIQTGPNNRFRHLVLACTAISICLGLATTAPAADGHPRIAAEWEPALGALVVWPPVVPDELLVEIAKDDRLFLIVPDLEQQ
jgi:hypothetical protein